MFSRTTRPISIKLCTNHPLVNGILNYSNKGPGPLQMGANHKKYQNGMGSFQKLLKNYWARTAQVYMKAFWYNVDSCFYKSWSQGVTIRKTILTCVYIKKESTSRPISLKLGTAPIYSWVNEILNCSNKGPYLLQKGGNHKNGVGSSKNLLLKNH
jgi:hypothetical protein